MNAPRNPNYSATLVELKHFVDLPNCDNVKAAIIFGNSVIVSKDSEEGDIGLFFPVETQLSHEFLCYNDLYRKAEYGNVSGLPGGFFEQKGRVKAMKFRGHKSEGFFIPSASIEYALGSAKIDDLPEIGDSFDYIGKHEICRKYVVKTERVAGESKNQKPKAKIADRIVENQFRLHYDTENLRRNAFKINPDDFISITDKWHGTSAVYSRVLTKRTLKWYEKLALKVGLPIKTEEYGFVYSSRKVVKSVSGSGNPDANHYYESDIWGVVGKEIEDLIPEGFTVYGEIVGYTQTGEPIQKGYNYGCMPGHHDFRVYRVTLTTHEGKVVELSWLQVQEFCIERGLHIVPTLYYGLASSFVSESMVHWHEEFLNNVEKTFVYDHNCEYNQGMVPAEGVVVRVDKLHQSEAYKLKSFQFLLRESKELDAGILDMETGQSEESDTNE